MNTQLVSSIIIIQHIEVASMAPFAYASDIFSSDIRESLTLIFTVITDLLSYSNIYSKSDIPPYSYELSPKPYFEAR